MGTCSEREAMEIDDGSEYDVNGKNQNKTWKFSFFLFTKMMEMEKDESSEVKLR